MMHNNPDTRYSSMLSDSCLIQEDMTACYYQVSAELLPDIIQTFLALESRLVWILCTGNPEPEGTVHLWYVFECQGNSQFQVLVVRTDHPVSVASWYPAASRFERAITDGFGIRFSESLDDRRLFLHGWYPEGFHPMKKSCENTPIQPLSSAIPFEFRKVEGDGVYQIPVGPVHAGIIEPGHFRFSVIGETILNLEIRLGYLHRGIEKLAEGMDPMQGTQVAESVSGDESAANACCYAMAVEQISGISIPERAEYLRALILELERSYSLFGDLAGMVTDVAFSVAASRFLILREELQRLCEKLSGSRFLKGIITIGGISQDIPDALLSEMRVEVQDILTEFKKIQSWTLTIPSVIDRFETTGVVREPLIDPLALSGPVARASGSAGDIRLDHPYGLYSVRPIQLVTRKSGDVLARFSLKGDEVITALEYILDLIPNIPGGPVASDPIIKDGYALAVVESARGRNLCFVQIKNRRIERFALSTASQCNWMALEHAVMGNIVADFPVINKSMNLSYAGTDL